MDADNLHFTWFEIYEQHALLRAPKSSAAPHSDVIDSNVPARTSQPYRGELHVASSVKTGKRVLRFVKRVR
jgi:hypothetical protein